MCLARRVPEAGGAKPPLRKETPRTRESMGQALATQGPLSDTQPASPVLRPARVPGGQGLQRPLWCAGGRRWIPLPPKWPVGAGRYGDCGPDSPLGVFRSRVARLACSQRLGPHPTCLESARVSTPSGSLLVPSDRVWLLREPVLKTQSSAARPGGKTT